MASASVSSVSFAAPSRAVIFALSLALHGIVLAILLTREPPAPLPEPPGQPLQVMVAPVATVQAVAAGAPAPMPAVTSPPVSSAATQTATAAPAPIPAAPPAAMSPVTTPSAPPAVQTQAIPEEPPPQKPVARPTKELDIQKPREERRAPPRPVRQPQRTQPAPSEAQPSDTPAPANAPIGEGGQSARTESPTHGDPRAAANYAASLSAWLSSNQHYPRQARMRRIEGTVVVYFRVDRQGHVTDGRIVSSSGSDLLDEEALAMLQRGQPPVPPADIPDNQLAHQVPIRFMLR